MLPLVAACAPPASPATGRRLEPIVYGADDRREVFEEPSPALRAVAAATVVLVEPEAVDSGEAAAPVVRAAPLGVALGLCEGERFAEQPAPADCTGVLIDDELVLTAAHCVSEDSCPRTFVLLDWALGAEGAPGFARAEQRYACRRVAARVRSAPDQPAQLDLAVFQLDRAVADGRAPVSIREAPASTGEPVWAVASVGGVPLKVTGPGEVRESRAEPFDVFGSNLDVFAAGSGAPIVDAGGALLGVLAQGGDDWVERDGCLAARRVPESGGDEEATHALAALAALCVAGWPSERLCGRASACGDGVCSAAESSAGCAVDCPPPVCGDLRCEGDEWTGCPADCGDRRPPGIPTAWWCPVEWYGDGGECDCACGADDPDCSAGGRAHRCTSIGPNGLPPPEEGGCAVAAGSPGRRHSPGGGLVVPGLALALATLRAARRRR